MIFYFTGTGNSLDAALTIARKTGDTLTDIGQANKYKTFDFALQQEESLGFIFPTYGWSTPGIIDQFLTYATFKDLDGNPFMPKYCFAVVLCGSFVGNTAREFAGRLHEKQGITLDASFSIKSVGNCVSMYAPAEGEQRQAILRDARTQAEDIAQSVSHRARVHRETRNPLGVLMSTFTGVADKTRSTKEFYTHTTCTHCGLCAEICPTNTITLIDGTPRWAERGCTQCFACVHHCPPHAIQYGKSTEGRSRYLNPVVLGRE